MLRLVGVQHRRNVVLGVAGGEQHARHGEAARHAPGAQLVETLADDRRGEFQEAALHRVLRQAGADAAGDGLELADRSLVATAVRSEEHTSELQSLMRISYAVFCLKNKND